MERTQLAKILREAVIFKNLRTEPLVAALTELLACAPEDRDRAFALCCSVARELYPHGDCLTDRILGLICSDDNFYIESIAKGESIPEDVKNWAAAELNAFSQAASLSSEYFLRTFNLSSPVPRWSSHSADFGEAFAKRSAEAAVRGYGTFASHHVFTVTEEGALLPVKNPDPQRIDELYGYQNERETVLANTRALLSGLPANNVLLYGDAGTGKSSTVKAIANEYKDSGLRLIQAEKGLLRYIPALLDTLASNPLKFIIFIDDLSFESDDRDFTALKTVLEGSVAARAKNTVIYATSNRRHLIRESMDARRGDEVHLNDTLEEASSLSARFGIVVTFVRPGKDDYIDLVFNIAKNYGLDIPSNELILGAEAYAIRSGGRSPRVAKQYIEYKIALK